MKKKNIIISIISFIIFICMMFLVLIKKELLLDTLIIDKVYSLRNDLLTSIFKVITFLGDSKLIILLTLLLTIYFIVIKKNKFNGILTFVNTANTAIINQVIKHIIRRPRPVNIIVNEDGYSFPSGHSMMSICFYALIIYFIWQTNMKKSTKIVLTVILSLLVLLIGFTRIYLGAHYPSDIISGYLITIAYMVLYIPLYKKLYKNN